MLSTTAAHIEPAAPLLPWAHSPALVFPCCGGRRRIGACIQKSSIIEAYRETTRVIG